MVCACLQRSRSASDHSFAPALSLPAAVTFHQLRPEHVCLVVATDGVWEVRRCRSN